MPQSETQSQALRIHDGAKYVVLHPQDDDLFVQTGRQVIEACRLNISIELWIHEVNLMFEHVANWAQERSDRVRACNAVPRHTKLVLFVAPRSSGFDFDLADDLAVLNRELLQAFRIGMIEVLQVPLDELERFAAPEESKPLYVGE